MTRKQAIHQAIQALSAFEGNEEAINLLQDISDEMPLIHWSDKSIRDTIEQFIVDNARIPTSSDFRKKGMPPHPVFKNKYGITLAEWLSIYYPQPKPNNEPKVHDMNEKFIHTYGELLPSSAKDYDRRRPKDEACWATVAHHNGCFSWRALLSKLSLPISSKHDLHRKNSEIKVTILHDLFENMDV